MSDWPRPVVLFQIQAKDLEKQKLFYSEMFDWDIDQIEGLPTLPTVYSQVEQLCQDPNVGADQLSRVIVE